MDIVVIIVIVILLFFIFSGGNPGYGRYTPSFGGANILWVILIVLAIIWLARRLF
jgi:hypothetical protein